MKKTFFRMSMLLAFVGLLSTSILSTSCGDDEDDEDGGTASENVKFTGYEANESDSTISITGQNLSQITGIKFNGQDLAYELTDGQLTFPYNGIPSGEQVISVIINGVANDFKVNIPGTSSFDLNIPIVTNVQPGDNGAVVLTGINLDKITKIEIGGTALGTSNYTQTARSLTFTSLEGVDVVYGEKTAFAVTYKGTDGSDKTISLDVTIPDFGARPVIILSLGTDGENFTVSGKNLDRVKAVKIGSTTYNADEDFTANEDGTLVTFSTAVSEPDKIDSLEVTFDDGQTLKFEQLTFSK